MPTAVREALSAAQVPLASPNPEAILGHHLLPSALLTSLEMSSCAGCRWHPKPGGEETNLIFPDLFSECPACFSDRGKIVKSKVLGGRDFYVGPGKGMPMSKEVPRMDAGKRNKKKK